jgi:hypothetical protein
MGPFECFLWSHSQDQISAFAEIWLAGKDSNLDKQLQKLRCYHYTTRQLAL